MKEQKGKKFAKGNGSGTVVPYGQVKPGRHFSGETIFCGRCGYRNRSSSTICVNTKCKVRMTQMERCGHCGELVENSQEDKYCRQCGLKYDDSGILPKPVKPPGKGTDGGTGPMNH